VMPTPTIIETDLREVLAEMNKKLDTISADMNRKLEAISKDVNQVQIRLATVETKVDNIEKRLDSMDKRFDKMELQIEKVENNQGKQVWALIGILFTAVVATSIRFVLMALPQS
jgi:tetrahydromethanopterin S-methyltransferase subunit G